MSTRSPGGGEVRDFLRRSPGIIGSCTKTSVPTGTRISRSSPSRPGLSAPFAVAAARRGKLGREAEVNEGVAVGIGDQIDRAALAAVAAIRPAARDELLAAEAERAAAAVSGRDVNVDFVDEHEVQATELDEVTNCRCQVQSYPRSMSCRSWLTCADATRPGGR